MESLAQAEQDFVEASNAARKDLEDSLTAIEKEFKDKLGKITDATKATNKEINALLTNFNNTKKLLETPIVIPAPVYAAGSGGGGGSSSSSSSSTTKTATTNITTNVTANTNASPTAIASVVTNGIKYGTVNTTTLAGIMAASSTSNTSLASGITRAAGGRGALLD
jgi:hypothetical protein